MILPSLIFSESSECARHTECAPCLAFRATGPDKFRLTNSAREYSHDCTINGGWCRAEWKELVDETAPAAGTYVLIISSIN